MKRTLAIDIETYSPVDISKEGVYKYVQHPDFAILMLAYAFDDEPARIVDLACGEELPLDVFRALHAPYTELTAHNAQFERTCINKFFNYAIPPERWSCTMVHASMVGLPMALGQVAIVLKLAQQKDTEGKALIRYFCVPCKPSKANGGRTRNLPAHAPEKWQKFKDYCVQDVVVEREIRNRISFYEISDTEKALYCLDQRINDRGVLVDHDFVENAIAIDAQHRATLVAEASALTGLSNVNSVTQVKAWLEAEIGEDIATLRKDDVTNLLGSTDSESAKRMLEIRRELSKTSIKKYAAMLACEGADGRARGLLQHYGAGRTGRWAGRLIQVQNMTKNDDRIDIDIPRTLVAQGNADMLDLLYSSIPDMLSQLVRTSFVAAPGNRFIVCDAAAIEARIIAWLADEQWRLEVFKTHGKIYEASAAQMFKVPIESIDKKNPLRQKGKISELALGFGGGTPALEAMGALRMGLTEDELQPLVDAWRKANPGIVALWKIMERAAIEAVETGQRVHACHNVHFYTQKGVLFMQLPSSRCLSYMRPQIKINTLVQITYVEDASKVYEKGKKRTLNAAMAAGVVRTGIAVYSGEPFNVKSLSYEGMNQTTKQWQRQPTYGGSLTENACQAIARDCLADAMTRVDAAGYKIILHVHDEIVMEVPEGFGSLEEVEAIMSEPLPWAPGLPLGADGFESKYYKK